MSCWFRATTVLVLGTLGAAHAQTIFESLLDGTTPPGIAPGGQLGSYPVSGLESVNLFSGALNFSVPLMTIGARGDARFTLAVPVETRWSLTLATVISGTEYMYVNDNGGRSTFVGYSPGYLEARTQTQEEFCGGTTYHSFTLLRLSWIAADGSEQELIDKKSLGTPKTTGLNCVSNQVSGTATYYDRGLEFVTTDGSAMTFLADPSSSLTDNPSGTGTLNGYLFRKDGVRYRIEAGRVRTMIDRNGNRIRFEVCSNAVHDDSPTDPCVESSPDRDAYSRPVRIIDALGRTVRIEYGMPQASSAHPNEDRIIFQGAEAATARTIYIRYADLSTLLRDGGTVQRKKDLFPSASYSGDLANINSDYYNPKLVSEIELPNQQKYTFKYNLWGELAQATLPTGGMFQYDWQPWTSPPNTDGIYGNLMVYRRLKERRVYLSSSTLESTTTYDAPLLGADGPNLTVTATEKGGGPLRKTVSTFWGTPVGSAAIVSSSQFGYPGWKEGRLYQEERQTTGGTVLQRIVNTWMNRNTTTHESVDPGTVFAPPGDPRITQTVRTLGAVSATTTFVYSLDAYNNLKERCETGYTGASRCTQWDYETSSSYTSTAVHLRGLVKSERVGPGSGTSFQKQSETQYTYDTGALTARANISEHDGTWATSYTLRGNPTTVARWRNLPASDDPWVRTQYQYDIAGNVTRVERPAVDTGGGQMATPITTVSYTDAYVGAQPAKPTFAFATTINHPGGLTTSAQFYYNAGQIASFTDPNGRVTSYQYGGMNASGTAALDPFTNAQDSADKLDRLTRVIHPLGQTVFVYTASQNRITTKKQLDSTSTVVSDSYVDGLGRPSRMVAPDGATVDTTYDALGRVYQVSNPYVGSPGAWATTTYDELDRPLDITHQDGSVTRARYTNNETLTRDAAGKWHKTVADGLGRLSSVYEDATGSLSGTTYSNTGADYLTSYTYNALDALTNVVQGGRDRAFTYDSLKQLLTASSPETGLALAEGDAADQNGVTSYEYDPVGNLTKRTDARGVATSYAYDVLGRVTRKSYSDTTLAVTYCYDGATGPGCTNAPADTSGQNLKNLKGRLTLVANGVSDTAYGEYDALGRVVSSSQSFSGLAGSYPFAYGYNFLALKSVTYPSQRQVVYGFDGAGRANSVGLNGTPGSYVSGVAYAPHGAIAQIAYAGGRYEQTCYNARLQVSAIVLRTAAPTGQCTDTLNNLWRLGLDYGTANNGNLMEQKIADGAGWEVTQSYAYDKLNRLETVEEPMISGGAGWKRTFGYDRWGNQWVDQNPANTNGVGSDTVTPNGASWITAKNRLNLSSGSYDRAGNQVKIAGYTATYDAESRTTGLSGSLGYAYDGEGRRVKKVSGSLTTLFVYDAMGQLAAEYTMGTPPAGTPEPSCSTCFLTLDHLGSTRVLWDAAGVKARYDYMPFGALVPADRNRRTAVSCAAGVSSCYAGDGSLTTRFTGKERDAETANSAMATGLDYFGARYFSGAQGRFTSPDKPFADQHVEDPQSWNLYSYVRNNPLVNVDPTGEDCVYTNNYNSDGTVTVERGNCSQKGGTFVDGTIDTKSFVVRNGNLEFGYTGANGAAGVHSMGLPSAPDLGLMALQRGTRLAEPGVNLAGAGTAAVMGGAFAGVAYGAMAGGSALTNLAIFSMPAVPSALEKLQKIGLSLQQAVQIVSNPASQKLIDTANGNNINVIQQVGDKLVRITLDPTGQRIISAGYVQGRNVANSIASGRFIKK